jgi:monoterpene epsilon-lactone hydrolase
MLLRIGVMLRACTAAAAVVVARLLRGPARPRWTWTHEFLVTWMKREFAHLAPLPWARQRKTWRAIALPALLVRAARFERARIASLDAMWVLPRDVAREGSEPTLLYFHGGAYLFGSIDEYRDFVARVARAGHARAVAVDYRLAPEHPFPAALEDALACYLALLESGVAPSRLVVAGDSAGGGLTASLLVALRDRGLPLPAGAVLLCPWVDLAAQGGTLESNSPTDVFTPDLVTRWARTVLAGADPRDPRASPAHADLHGLPPMLVQVGDVEMILDQVVAFANKARAAGIEARLRVWEDCFHDWPVYAPLLADGRRAIDEIGAFVREVTLAASEA